LRKHLGWSWVDSAWFFQADPSVVSRWELGKQNMDVRGEQVLGVVATRLAPIASKHGCEALLLRPSARRRRPGQVLQHLAHAGLEGGLQAGRVQQAAEGATWAVV
jgi:hypothetical protein